MKNNGEISGDWFVLKQAFKEWLEKEIEEDCDARNYPNKTRLTNDYCSAVIEMVKDIIIDPVEKERRKNGDFEYFKLKTEMRKWLKRNFGKKLLNGKMVYNPNLLNKIFYLVITMIVKTLIYLTEIGKIYISCGYDNIERFEVNALKE